MSWNRSNWKTTTLGVLAALGMVAGTVFPPAKPIADALSALAVAMFGFFAADGSNVS